MIALELPCSTSGPSNVTAIGFSLIVSATPSQQSGHHEAPEPDLQQRTVRKVCVRHKLHLATISAHCCGVLHAGYAHIVWRQRAWLRRSSVAPQDSSCYAWRSSAMYHASPTHHAWCHGRTSAPAGSQHALSLLRARQGFALSVSHKRKPCWANDTMLSLVTSWGCCRRSRQPHASAALKRGSQSMQRSQFKNCF